MGQTSNGADLKVSILLDHNEGQNQSIKNPQNKNKDKEGNPQDYRSPFSA
jgi:hypothetical protein